MTKIYTVFVDGLEVNDYYLTLKDAKLYHADYTAEGYEPYVHKTLFNKDGTVEKYVHVPLESDKVYLNA